MQSGEYGWADHAPAAPPPWTSRSSGAEGPPRPRLLLIDPDPWTVKDPIEAAAGAVGFAVDQRSEVRDVLVEVSRRSGVALVLLGPAVPARLETARRLRAADPAVRIALLFDGPAQAAEDLRAEIRADDRLRGACEVVPSGPVDRLAARLSDLAERRSDRRPKRADFADLGGRLTAEVTGRGQPLPAGSLVSERYLVTLLEQAGEAIISTDPDGRIVLWNHEAARLFDLSSEAAVGSPLRDLVPEVDRPAIDQILRLACDGEAGRTEIIAPGPSGDRMLELSAAAVRDGGEALLGISVLARDVTERHQIERALIENNCLKDEFLTVAGHELRTPVTTLRAFVQTLLRQINRSAQPVPTTRIAQTLGRIDQEMNRLIALVNELLDLGQLQSQSFRLRRQRTDLVPLVQQAAGKIRPQLLPRQELHLDLPPAPLWAEVDAGRLDQALVNLLANARKFSPGGGRITVRLRPAGETAEIVVADQGIGLPRGARDHLFEPYFRASNAPARSYAGLGLGLYLARVIIERHGGRITAESDGEGRGSAFRVTLPVRGNGE